MDETVLLRVNEDGADADRVEELSLDLRDNLLELNEVDDVSRFSQAAATKGTRGVDAATVGALLVTATASIDLVKSIVAVARGWLNRGPRERSVELSIGDRSLKLQAASPAEQERLVEQFLSSLPK